MITSLDKSAIIQRTTGTTLKILKTGRAEDKKEFTAMAEKLRQLGLPATVIGKDEVRAIKKPARIAGIELRSKAIRLTSPTGEEVVKLDGTLQCIIALSTQDHERLHSKRLTRRSLPSDEPITTQEMLRFIFNHKPVMDIYISGIATPLRIDAMGRALTLHLSVNSTRARPRRTCRHSCERSANTAALSCSIQALGERAARQARSARCQWER